MKLTAALTLIYAVLVLAGGIAGHIQAGSNASLVAGILSGVYLLWASLLAFRGKAVGEYLALLGVFLLDGFFTYRFLATKKFTPAGLMSLISLAFLFLLAILMRRRLAKR